jgi:hypothetical protein
MADSVSDSPEVAMTLCPIALAVGCQKCPIFKVCPVKSVIGDYHPAEPAPVKQAAAPGRPSGPTKKAPATHKKGGRRKGQRAR